MAVDQGPPLPGHHPPSPANENESLALLLRGSGCFGRDRWWAARRAAGAVSYTHLRAHETRRHL
eukprot:7016430-Prorocentrum_lima.AAC.1